MVAERRALRPGEKLPPNSRLLEGEELSNFLQKEIEAYRPSRDMLPLIYAPVPIMLSAAASVISIHGRFTRLFKLRGGTAIFSYFPALLPSVAACLTMHFPLSNDIIRGATPCPVCVETRAISTQILFGGIYPMIISPITCAVFSAPRGLAPSLLIKGNVQATWAYICKRPKVYIMATLFSGLAGGIFTFLEQSAAWKLHSKLYNKTDHQGGN